MALVFSKAIFRAGILQKFIETFHFEPPMLNFDTDFKIIKMIVTMVIDLEQTYGIMDVLGFCEAAFYTLATKSSQVILDASLLAGVVSFPFTIRSITTTLVDNRYTGFQKTILTGLDTATLVSSIGFAALGTAIGGVLGPVLAIIAPILFMTAKSITQYVFIADNWTVIPK